MFRVNHIPYLTKAFTLAFEGMNSNKGGPFGALIVKDGQIIGSGCNEVVSSINPTAHAEINAIKEACRETGHFHLEGATIYCTCEPCPMCLAAIYWARIETVVFASQKEEAASIGFSDLMIYKDLGIRSRPDSLKMVQINHPLATTLFREWMEKGDKVLY